MCTDVVDDFDGLEGNAVEGNAVPKKPWKCVCISDLLSYFSTPTNVLYFAEAAGARPVTFESNGGSILTD